MGESPEGDFRALSIYTQPMSPVLATREPPLVSPDDPYVGNPWEKQPYETTKAFLGFTIYRDMGVTRTLLTAEREYRNQLGLPQSDTKRPTSNMAKWSRLHHWAERIAAYETWQDEQEIAALRRKRVQLAGRHAEQAAKASNVLMHPIQKLEQRLAEIKEGTRTSDLDELSDEELIRLGRHTAALLTDLHKTEREALDSTKEPGRRQNVRVKGEILRRIITGRDTDAIGMLEQVSFELAQVDAEAERSADVGAGHAPSGNVPRFLTDPRETNEQE